MQIYFVDTVFAFIFSKFAAGILSNYLIIKCLPIMTKHVPLFTSRKYSVTDDILPFV